MDYLQTRTNTYVKMSPSPTSTDDQRGAIAVEAAVGLPFFLAVILTSFQLLVFCFQLLSFQYSVTNETTRVFLNQTQSTDPWQDQLAALIGAEGNRLNLCPDNATEDCTWPDSPPAPGESGPIQIDYFCNGVTCTDEVAGAGDLARVTVEFTKPFFKVVENIGLEPLTMQVSAVSGISRNQGT